MRVFVGPTDPVLTRTLKAPYLQEGRAVASTTTVNLQGRRNRSFFSETSSSVDWDAADESAKLYQVAQSDLPGVALP
jgi:hypothetical protein